MSARKPAAAKVVKAPPRGRSHRPAAPVPAGAPESDTSAIAKKLAADVTHALAQGQTDVLSPEAVQALMAAVCRTYSAQIEAGGDFPALANRSPVTSTDVMVTASGLLKSANLAVFELGMWQSWTGR